MRPAPLLLAAVVMLAGLAWHSWHPPPLVAPKDAAQHEGQEVRMEGQAQAVRPAADGRFRFDLRSEGWAVPVLGDGAPPGEGQSVRVAGRLARLGGTLLLLAAPGGVELRPGAPAPVALALLAAEPARFEGSLVDVAGTVDGGALRDGPVSVRTGEGPWPRSGPVLARAVVRHEPACACTVLDAREVRPWSP